MLLDNKQNGKVGDTLRNQLTKGSKLSIISGLFSIYGFESLKKEFSRLDDTRLLLSRSVNSDEDSTNPFPELTGDIFEQRFKNQLNQMQVAKECARWIEQKVHIKATGMANQNLFHVEKQNEQSVAIQGSSHFTSTGLGYSESDQFDMNMCLTEPSATKGMLEWFDAIWDSPSAHNAKELLLNQLNKLTQNQSPQFIYFLTLYHLFKGFLEEIDEDSIIKSKTGFKDTVVWNKLYKFQKDGVLGAIDKLERYNGCIIADSVGLGKTFSALAVIKYYELRNDRVLVLCPKKLRENWTVYTINDKRNLLASDRFNYDVLNHTDLTRVSGKSGEINLETINWGNYDLVVIDESHNFRNSSTAKEGYTRYSRLMDEIIRSGVKTKVLMLSATPVNNRMNDLKNQVAFITEGQDTALEEHGIASIEITLKKAQTQFNQWLKLEEHQRSTEALLDGMNFDYFKLLDLLTIARSRKHIEKYYDIAEIGAFPERLKPLNIKEDIDAQGQFPPLREINRIIRRLNLSAYAPLKYVRMDKRQEYNRKYDIEVKGGSVFKMVDREQSLIHLMRVNLLKRMESSIHSFSLTLGKLLAEVDGLLDKLANHASDEVEELSINDIEVDAPEFGDYLIGKKVKILIKDMDHILWRQDLEEDRARLQQLLTEAQAIDAERDAKLHRLQSVIENKCQNPLNTNNRKVIIFTAFADTAQYLYQQIAPWAETTLGLHSALVTGSGSNKTTMTGVGSDLNNLLTAFSPVSKERGKIDDSLTEEIDILIATDCISEGQNLQDCDFLINYDIHWNPVRIIQRFGRVDRLGSKNTVIQLVNFWPNMELDEYINLEARVSGRMVLLDISATGEENVIEQDTGKQMNDLEYRRRQLQELQDNVVDLEDISGSVSITDLTLNDFRMDLSGYMKEHLDELESAYTGLFSCCTIDKALSLQSIEPGVLFCLKQLTPVQGQSTDAYALAPHYLVYVTDDNEVKYPFTQTKKMLDILRKQGQGHHLPDQPAIQTFHAITNNGKDMSHYRQLLETAVGSIIGKSEEKGIDSLFSRGGTHLTQDSFQGMEDFEVVSYLIINQGVA
ncbi:helicase-related protein [Endozoicomonas lisbonensis]|uniref:Superfamily II DNA or RNA helicase n=1 Tax=Endozoicomonas lisbonensis TaxID=3120522 RepID=A0ABV2SQD6_9GAMM